MDPPRYRSTPGQHPTRIDLDGPQRRTFLTYAAVCGTVGTVSALACVVVWLRYGHAVFFQAAMLALLALILLPVTPVYLRSAYAWIELEPRGIRMSRLLPKRFIGWADINDMWQDTYSGRDGRYFTTVVKVQTTGGRTYRLPAPRNTLPDARDFERTLEYLKAQARRHGGLRRRLRSPRDKPPSRALFVFLVTLYVSCGLGMLGGLIYTESQEQALLNRGVTATGTVIDKVRHDRDTSWEVEVARPDGTPLVLWTSDVPDGTRIGAQVQIVYDPQHPDNTRSPDSTGITWMMPVVFLPGAAFFFWLAHHARRQVRYVTGPRARRR